MSCIKTYPDRLHFDYANPKESSISINDIAQALSNECRFAGHLPNFYSVAEHSWLVSQLVSPEFALEALLHDASEAYCKDIPSPLKRLLPDYKGIERGIDLVIRSKFGLPADMSPEVHHFDLVMLATERQELEIDDGEVWPMLEGIQPANIAICPMSPGHARVVFLARFNELTAASQS
ncbi:HD family hydrolase [Yersinia sp. 1652 StPb PI]|uniref:HD family hydrolase n=1 Tax=Yersinia sp. 1652 StPb PI TaxID=3061649 RepID=UPI00355BC407